MRRRPFLVLTAVAMAAAIVSVAPRASRAQDRGMRPAGGEGVLAIVGGDVYVGNGVVFRRGTVICRGSKIEAVGPALDVPEGARVIDATGQRVLPGFVAPKGGNFGIRRGRPRSGEKFGDCLDADSTIAELALASGITTYYAAGRARGISTEQTAVIKPAYKTPELMMVKEPSALELGWSTAGISDRGKLRTQLDAAQKWIAAGKKGRSPASAVVVSALSRDIPVRIRAQTRAQILGAITLAKTYDFRLVLDDAYEAWTCAAEVAASGAIVVVQPRTRRWPSPGAEDSSGSTIECAAILEKAGARFCVLPPGGFGGRGHGIATGGIVGRDMLTYPLEAAFAIRGGASPDAALRAITLTAAEALGVEQRVGSLERGKDADIVIYPGDPFDYRLMPETTIVSGRVLYERTKSALFGHLPPR